MFFKKIRFNNGNGINQTIIWIMWHSSIWRVHAECKWRQTMLELSNFMCWVSSDIPKMHVIEDKKTKHAGIEQFYVLGDVRFS